MSGVTMSAMARMNAMIYQGPSLQLFCRALSTDAAAGSSKMVDDLLQYVYSSTASSQDQAIDIIRSGLGSQPDAEGGLGSARYAYDVLSAALSILLIETQAETLQKLILRRHGVSGCTWRWQRSRGTGPTG